MRTTDAAPSTPSRNLHAPKPARAAPWPATAARAVVGRRTGHVASETMTASTGVAAAARGDTRESTRPSVGTGARVSAQNGSSGSTAIATNNSVR